MIKMTSYTSGKFDYENQLLKWIDVNDAGNASELRSMSLIYIGTSLDLLQGKAQLNLT